MLKAIAAANPGRVQTQLLVEPFSVLPRSTFRWRPRSACLLHVRLSHQQSWHRPLPCRSQRAASRTNVWAGLERHLLAVPGCRNSSGDTRAGSWRPQGQRPPPPGIPAFSRLLLRAFAGSIRALFMPFRGHTLRTLYRQNPEELVLALVVLVVSAGVLVYVVRIYFTYFNSQQFTRYPPPVAKALRRALYYSNYSPDPKRALRYYREALEKCAELRLDPFSDDVIGIRIQLAAWLEKVENYGTAIKILELVLGDCREWVEHMEQSVAKGGESSASARLLSRLPTPLRHEAGQKDQENSGSAAVAGSVNGEIAAGNGHDDAVSDNESDFPETLWGRRSRILKKAIGLSVKLGELYADEHVLNVDLAHERLVWAVDTALGEFQRRSKDGLKDGEGEWMSPKEMGAALESLGHSYESRSQFQLALPLFFQALRLCDDPCHSAVIMNNLAVCFAQHPLQPPYETLVGSVMEASNKKTPPTQEEARKAYIETAQRWALNARNHAVDTLGEARTPECDSACAVALCNLGDFSAMMGDVEAARRWFGEGRAISEKTEFAPGVQQAEDGLLRLQSR